MENIKFNRPQNLYMFIITLFAVVVVLSNLIALKLFPAPFSNGIPLPSGLITYPISFVLSDLVTEIYGKQKAKLMVLLGFLMCIVAHLIVMMALALPAYEEPTQKAFKMVFGLNGLIIFSSMIAYTFSQLLDIFIFDYVKRLTQGKYLWLRNNVSTLISQLLDTFIVLGIVFGYGMGVSAQNLIAMIGLSYLYKAFFSVSTTPIFYLFVTLSKKYLNENVEVQI